MKRLGVNIDHVATLRNARGGFHPDPFLAAKQAMVNGADSITIHLREDRRHIKDIDLKNIAKSKIPLNLEIAANDQMLKIALRYKPNFICLVPEKRKEITTDGVINISKNLGKIKKIIKKFMQFNSRKYELLGSRLKDQNSLSILMEEYKA